MTDRHKLLASIFKALGDANRIRIMEILSGYEQCCVGMLTGKLNISQPAVSQHLKILKNAGLVSDERVGFHVHYRLNRRVLKEYNNKYFRMMKLDEPAKACKECPEAME